MATETECDDQAPLEHPQPSSTTMPGRHWHEAGLDLRGLLVQQHAIISKRLDSQDELLRRLVDLPRAGIAGLTHLPWSAEPQKKRDVPSDAPVKVGSTRLFQTFEQEDRSRQREAKRVSLRHSATLAEMGANPKPSEQQGILQKIVKSTVFEMFFALVVVLNSVFIGIEVEVSISSFATRPPEIYLAQYIFACLFTVELALRWGAAGWKFFFSDDWAWSWFDLFVVLTSIWEVVLDMLYSGPAADDSSSRLSGMSGLRTFRIIRITRIAKTIRLLRMFRMVLALRTLIASIVNTLKSLLWALVLLGLIVYVFSVLFCQAVSSHMLDPLAAQLPERELMLAQRHFASLGDSYLSLFMSIAGGVSWEELMAPIKQISIAWVLLFLFYISFTCFAVLNVVTAVFCQSAMEGAQNDHASRVQAILADKEAHVQKIRKLFSEFGADDVVTYEMFRDKFNTQAVQEYFATIGLEVPDAWSLFKLLDMDGGGAVEVEEFLDGCLRLRGQATALDVGKIIHEQAWLLKNQGKFQAFVEVELRHVKRQLGSITGMFTHEFASDDVGAKPFSSCRSSWKSDQQATAEHRMIQFPLVQDIPESVCPAEQRVLME